MKYTVSESGGRTITFDTDSPENAVALYAMHSPRKVKVRTEVAGRPYEYEYDVSTSPKHISQGYLDD